MSKQMSLFKTKVVPVKPVSGNLFHEEIVSSDRPVKCLGLEFETDDAIRSLVAWGVLEDSKVN